MASRPRRSRSSRYGRLESAVDRLLLVADAATVFDHLCKSGPSSRPPAGHIPLLRPSPAPPSGRRPVTIDSEFYHLAVRAASTLARVKRLGWISRPEQRVRAALLFRRTA